MQQDNEAVAISSHTSNKASPLILDGGLGTELEKRGCDLRDSLWSARVLLVHPDIIEQVHFDFLRAGADCITTSSYQISFEGFSRAGLSHEETIQALRRSVSIACRARKRALRSIAKINIPMIAASVGPFGAHLGDGSEFHGDYKASESELRDFHKSRLAVLQETAADILACETIPSLAEAEVILRILRSNASKSAWFSFCCTDELHTVHGERIGDCARLLDKEDVVAAVGVNCTKPQFIASLVREIRSATSKPIVVYPNVGKKWDAVQRAWVGEESPLDLAAMAEQWYRLGAQWIGGCCGVGPDDIRQIRSKFSETSSKTWKAEQL